MTQNGTLEIQDVQQNFDELLSWEKKEFLYKNCELFNNDDFDKICDKMHIDPYELCIRLTPEDICEHFSTSELLNEIGDYSIIRYICSHDLLSNESIIKLIDNKISYNNEDNNNKLKNELIKLIEKI